MMRRKKIKRKKGRQEKKVKRSDVIVLSKECQMNLNVP